VSTITNLSLKVPAGYASREVGLFLAQMDDQSRRLHDVTRDITPDELAWQSSPGMNTIGMLLAHIAIAESWWVNIVLKGNPDLPLEPVLGIGVDDDGMPVPGGGLPPANLAGKPAAFFDDLLARARRYLKEGSTAVADAELEREIERSRPDGSKRLIYVRWFYYHLLEHFAGHFGQILMLRHLYRAVREPAAEQVTAKA